MSSGKRIVVVEDEPSIADNIVYALSTEGFEPQWCQTAEEALSAVAENEPALLILDVGLPDENGFEVAKRIRKMCEVPIIFVTARSDEVDRIVGLEIGADDYVVKPFSPRELTARVKAVLRRTAGSPRTAPDAGDEEYSYGPFRLQTSKHCLLYHEQPVELSRYEFRILSILLKRPGRVYSRELLMQLAWEEPDMSLERTVDTHIKTIRRKLRAICKDEDLIITHRGVGYSLKEVA